MECARQGKTNEFSSSLPPCMMSLVVDYQVCENWGGAIRTVSSGESDFFHVMILRSRERIRALNTIEDLRLGLYFNLKIINFGELGQDPKWRAETPQ